MSKANDGLSTPETVPSIADRLWADTEIPPELQSPEFAAYTRAHEAFYSWNSPEDIPDSLRDADGAGVVAVLKRLARSEFDVFEKAIALRDLIIAPGDGEAHSIANSEDVISLIMAIIDLYRADLPLLNLGAELRSRWAAGPSREGNGPGLVSRGRVSGRIRWCGGRGDDGCSGRSVHPQ